MVESLLPQARRSTLVGATRRRTLAGMAGLAALLLGAALPVGAQTAPAAPLRVVASFSILADMVRQVGGPAVQVHSLVGPGGDAHVFSPTPADARQVAQAELVVVNGLRYEGWIDRLVHSAGYKGKVVVASQGAKLLPTAGGSDPHAWQNLANAKVYVANLRDALVAARPAEADGFRQRAAAYLAQMDTLEQRTRERIGRLPFEKRRVLTGHDAFGYFAMAYGVQFVAPRGWSTEAEPTADTVARIVRQAREQRISALLVENISDPRLVDRIAREAGIAVGGTLYSDALSPAGGPADTYLRMFAHNVDTLLGAIEKSGPAGR